MRFRRQTETVSNLSDPVLRETEDRRSTGTNASLMFMALLFTAVGFFLGRSHDGGVWGIQDDSMDGDRNGASIDRDLVYDAPPPKIELSQEVALQASSCASVPNASGKSTMEVEIEAILRTGRGANAEMPCLSPWYCCDKGHEYWDDLEATRTERNGFLQLPRDLFGSYLTSFAKHLTDFYSQYPSGYQKSGQEKGVFLDIGGTGSTVSGMTQVTTKFTHFAGPLDYWVLDSDPAASKLSNAIVCDVDDCPAAIDCSYDVTFSFTVLEHAARPWKSFDTIARITKKGGLTLHLVPWSYQYHATPDDSYRFSHRALTTLLEDRGFEVLDVGYDICTQPQKFLRNKKDEHFDIIWLTYVVGRKL